MNNQPIEETTKKALKLLKEQPERVKAFGEMLEALCPGEIARISDKIAKRMAEKSTG